MTTSDNLDPTEALSELLDATARSDSNAVAAWKSAVHEASAIQSSANEAKGA